MFELNEQIEKWRNSLIASKSFQMQDIDELESHLRDEIDELSDTKLSPEEVFVIAINRLGYIDNLAGEYAKVNRNTAKINRITLILLGIFYYLSSLVCGKYIANYFMQIAIKNQILDYSTCALIRFCSELSTVTGILLSGLLIYRCLINFPAIVWLINRLSSKSTLLICLLAVIIYERCFHTPVPTFRGMNFQPGLEHVLTCIRLLWLFSLPAFFVILLTLSKSNFRKTEIV